MLSLLDLARVSDHAIARPDRTLPHQTLPRMVLVALGAHLNRYEGLTGHLPGGWDVLWSLSIEEAFRKAFHAGFALVRLGLGRFRLLFPILLGLAAPSPPASASRAPRFLRRCSMTRRSSSGGSATARC